MDLLRKDNITQSKPYTWNESELQEFKEIVLKEKGLNSRTDDIFLLSFLRSRKYNKEDALTLLKNYYAVRRNTPELKNLKPSALEHALQSGFMTHLCVEGYRVFTFGRTSHWDPTKLSALDLGKCILLHHDYLLNNHLAQVSGITELTDVKDLSWRHLVACTPRIIRLLATVFYKTLPVSFKSFHYVNCNRYIFAIATLVLPFVPKKLRKRIHFHGSNFDALHKEIDPKYLPVEYGGKLLSFDWSESNQTIRDNEEFFVENEKYWNNDQNN